MGSRRITRDIRFLVLDVDGVLTDGGMYCTESGDQFKKFNTKDGMGIKTLTSRGFPVAFLSSGSTVALTTRRATLLGVQHCYVGSAEKLEVLTGWCQQLGLSPRQVAYVGDDVNDLKVMAAVGFSACPLDAVLRVRKAADVVLRRKGGDACVREFIERFIQQV